MNRSNGHLFGRRFGLVAPRESILESDIVIGLSDSLILHVLLPLGVRMSTFDEHDEPFSESELTSDPMDLFHRWYEQAQATSPGEWYMPNAMILATVDADQRPHSRTVLLKQVDGKGFFFFTNYLSAKGRELATNPNAALTFYWPHLYRQVRVEGTVTKASFEVSENYFHSRPRGSQLSACVSPQSEIVPSRTTLEQRKAELVEKFEGQEIPLPENWGGYELTASSIEFWQSRRDRLHDRFLYQLDSGSWSWNRLAP